MRHTRGCWLIISLALFSFSEAAADCLARDKPSLDSFGDPLPEGVFYRLGTVRLRHQHTQTLICSADGSQLHSQGATPDLRVWDVATGRILQQIAAPEHCRHLIASPDDRYLACVASVGKLGAVPQVVLLDKASG